MLSSKVSFPESGQATAPDIASATEFPSLAPSPKKLDLTPRPPMAPCPLANYPAPKPRNLPARKTPVQTRVQIEPLPKATPRPARCVNTWCPVTGYHLAKIYTPADKDLPKYVNELMGRAEKAESRGVKHENNECQKKLDRFFNLHSEGANVVVV